jgi:serine/threonine-protein kinase
MSERLSDGTVFGTYTIEGLIAGGGMGQVYAARHNIYGSAVALKVLHPALHADKGWRERFNEEGLVGTQLKHPNVLSARELVENEGRIALVVDLVPGGQTLEKVIAREFRDGIGLVPSLQVFLKILQGMDYLHTKGIVHGDLKPENVMIEGDFRHPETWIPKVTDFGTVSLIANPVEIDGRPAVVATPRYASPEHLYGVDQIVVRSDIYCLALILHFLLSGRHASNAQNVREAAERVMLPVPIVNLVDQPEVLVEVFQRATALELEDRFPTVRALALAIRGVLDAIGAELVLPDVAADLATEVDEERAKQRTRAAAAARTSASQAATEADPRVRARTPQPQSQPTPPPRPTDDGALSVDTTPPPVSQSTSPTGRRLRESTPDQPLLDPPADEPPPKRTPRYPPSGETPPPKPKTPPVPISAAARGEPVPAKGGIPWFVFGAAGLVVVMLVVIVAIAVGSS